jgi:hypothetical protein
VSIGTPINESIQSDEFTESKESNKSKKFRARLLDVNSLDP